jgi:hypothetical protein
MVKVRIQATQKDFEQAEGNGGGDFVVPPAGVYVLSMEECNHGFSKTNGEVDETKPRLECVYTIVGIGPEEQPVKENYGKLWDYVSFSEASGWKRAEFLKAFKLIAPNATQADADVTIDTDDVVNRKVVARLKHEKGQNAGDPPRAKVARLIAYGTDLSAASEESAPEYTTDTGFGGDVATPFDEQGNEVTPYTAEELEAMDLKSLGAILKDDFEGTPQDHIVKGTDGKTDTVATKRAVVAAILEAQGGDAPAEDVEDDDPF